MTAASRPVRQWRRPGSEAAHRLAWWLCVDDARWQTIAADAEISPAIIDRLLSGEVQPSADLALAIADATDGAVLPMDWERGTSAVWDAKPVAREAAAA